MKYYAILKASVRTLNIPTKHQKKILYNKHLFVLFFVCVCESVVKGNLRIYVWMNTRCIVYILLIVGS